MQTTSKIFRLKGVVQHYTWGGSVFLPELLQRPNLSAEPYAEYWMGAHENAPSLLELKEGSEFPLNKYIQQHNKEVLGSAVSRQFGRLPYLFKVLDVKDMLSIQVHPSKKTAVIEFEAENKKGIPAGDAARNYKDDNHKPELMVAWSDFWLLHGFKPPASMEKILNNTPELGFLLPVWNQSRYEGIYKKVMQAGQEEVNTLLQPLINRILPLYKSNRLTKSAEDFWAARAYQTFCTKGIIDRGLFSIYFLNLVHLQPGEAIFQDAGILHAYLEGHNLEIMANSDNVLRGGLTNKKIDVPELLKHVLFHPIEPVIIKGQPVNNSKEEVFKTPAADFELSRIILAPGESTIVNSHTAEIFFVSEGELLAREEADSIMFGRGECFIAMQGARIAMQTGKNRTVVFRATVPE